jgi:hypothetical protein
MSFFLFFGVIFFPSGSGSGSAICVRIRIQQLKLMRIHADPDPDPKPRMKGPLQSTGHTTEIGSGTIPYMVKISVVDP